MLRTRNRVRGEWNHFDFMMLFSVVIALCAISFGVVRIGNELRRIANETYSTQWCLHGIRRDAKRIADAVCVEAPPAKEGADE